MKFNVDTIPVISTCHMTHSSAPEDADCLFAEYEYGYFVWIDQDAGDFPQWYLDVRKWAKANGYTWVRFDRDANPVEGLATYDW